MSEFLAEAQVVVRANTKQFLKDFETAVKQVEKQKVTVTVRASMAGFRNDLNDKLRRAEKSLVIRPRVRADMTGFREDLERKVLRASKGVFATVNVKAGKITQASAAAAGGGVTSGGVVDKRAAAAQLALNSAVAAGVAARRRITAAISDEEKFASRLERQELHLKASIEAVGKAALSEVPELLELAQAEERAARAALALSAAQEERRALGVPIGVSTADFKAQITAMEQLHEAALFEDRVRTKTAADAVAANKKRLADMAALHAAAIIENKDLDERIKRQKEADELARQERLLGPASNLTRTRNRLGQFVAGGGAAIGAEAAERNQLVTTSTKGLEAAKTELAKASRVAATAELLELDVEKQLVASRQVLRLTTEAVVVATEAWETALASGSVLAAENAKKVVKLAEAQQALAATEAQAANAAATRAGLLTTGRRALVAQIANLTGLRGAALTAASGFIAVSAAVIGLRKALKVAGDLQTELSTFQVTAGATADQMENVREKAVELGRDITLPAVSSADAAQTLTELSKAGLSVQDSIDGAKGVLQLATAANIDFTQATTLAASALNAFGLAGEEAGHVADVLANSANESQGSITDAGVALQQSAAVARQAGLSLEQTVAALTLFARAGLRGSDAGTSLRTALIRLINPSKKAEDVIHSLGLRIRDAQGNINLGVFQQFQDATKKMTAAQRDQALAIVFGQDAIRGAAILAREGAAGLQREERVINKQGTAAEVASARTSGYAGALENLKNQIETVGEEIGSSLLPAFTSAANLLSDTIQAVDGTAAALDSLFQTIKKPFNLVFNVSEGKSVQNRIDEIRRQASDVTKPIERRPVDTGSIIENLILGNPVHKLNDISTAVEVLSDDWRKLNETVEDTTGFDFVEAPTFKQARKDLQDFIKEINKSGGSPEAFNDAVIGLRKLRDELASGTFEEQQFSKKLDTFITNLQNKSAKKFKPITIPIGFDSVDPKTLKDPLKDAKEEIKGFVSTLNGVAGSKHFDVVVEGLQKLRKELQGGTKDEKALSNELADFIESVQVAAAQGQKVEIPFELKTPEDVESFLSKRFEDGFFTLGFSSAKAFAEGFKGQFFPQLKLIVDETVPQFTTLFTDAFKKAPTETLEQFAIAAQQAIKDRIAGVKTATTKAEGRSSGFDRKILDAQLKGDVNAEIAVRKAAIASRQREIAAIEKAARKSDLHGKGGLSDAALKNVNDAKKDILAQQQAIDSLTSQQTSDREKKAADLKEKRDKADQAFLDALEVGRTPFERRVARAEATTGAQDNISALLAFRKRINAEIAAVRVGVKDGQTKAKALQKLSDELFQNTLDIEAARKTRDDAIVQALQDKGTALQDLGQATGNFALALKGFDLQIAAAKKLLKKAKEDASVQKQAADAVSGSATERKKLFTVGKPKGLATAGNIDLLNRPPVPTPGKKGFTSTVRSITVAIERDGKKLFALIPTVVNKAVVSNQAAIKQFQKTGKNLGIFTTEKLANAYAGTLHNQQAGLTKSVKDSTTDLVTKAITTGTKDVVSDAALTVAQANVAKALKAKLDFIKETRKSLLESAAGLAEAKFTANPTAKNKSLLLQVIDLQIAEANKEAAAAKTLPERWQAATDAITLAQKKKEILAGELEKDQKTGTTVLDLLRQGVETFNASAGNLINADQPFAGPNAFNADIAQFLKFRKKVPDLTDIGNGTGGGGFGVGGGPRGAFSFARGGFQFQQKADPIVSELIEALKGLTSATLAASGNSSSSGGKGANVPVVKGSPWAGKPWFGWGANARSAQES